MKKNSFLIGILAIVLVFGMTVVGCGNDSTDSGGGPTNPLKVEYKGEDAAGNIYTLTITENTNRAVYVGVTGDSYELIIGMKNGLLKISKGTITATSTDGTFTLQPSVAGADTFNVVISGTDIKSIVGAIAVEGGTPVTPGTFDTIYLRANRWIDSEGKENENWGTIIKLSDFITGTISNNSKIRISGTVNTKCEHIIVSLRKIMSNGKEEWLGFGPAYSGSGGFIINGTFSETITLYIDSTVNQTNGEIIVDFVNQIKENHPSFGYLDYGTIPENISNGTIMATISNFNISLVE